MIFLPKNQDITTVLVIQSLSHPMCLGKGWAMTLIFTFPFDKFTSDHFGEFYTKRKEDSINRFPGFNVFRISVPFIINYK